jgi:hypothetical protein
MMVVCILFYRLLRQQNTAKMQKSSAGFTPYRSDCPNNGHLIPMLYYFLSYLASCFSIISCFRNKIITKNKQRACVRSKDLEAAI